MEAKQVKSRGTPRIKIEKIHKISTKIIKNGKSRAHEVFNLKIDIQAPRQGFYWLKSSDHFFDLLPVDAHYSPSWNLQNHHFSQKLLSNAQKMAFPYCHLGSGFCQFLHFWGHLNLFNPALQALPFKKEKRLSSLRKWRILFKNRQKYTEYRIELSKKG